MHNVVHNGLGTGYPHVVHKVIHRALAWKSRIHKVIHNGLWITLWTTPGCVFSRYDSDRFSWVSDLAEELVDNSMLFDRRGLNGGSNVWRKR